MSDKNAFTETWNPWKARIRSFDCKTLQDNWFEDRIQAAEDEESHQEHIRETREHSLNVLVGFGNVSQPLCAAPTLVRHNMPPSNRTLRGGDTNPDYSTTTKEHFQGGQAQKDPLKSTKMVLEKNYYQVIHTDRTHKTLPVTGFGGILPSHPPGFGDSNFETTNDHFYAHKAAAHRLYTPVPPEQGDDKRWVGGYPASKNPNAPDRGEVYSTSKSFNHAQHLPQDTLDTFMVAEPPRGKMGSRGHLVRKCEESGSKYGSHVWADEYASAA